MPLLRDRVAALEKELQLLLSQVKNGGEQPPKTKDYTYYRRRAAI